MSRAANCGMMLIEVMACVLVITVALLAACAMVIYGLRIYVRAHGEAIGTDTAISVLVDPAPLRTDPSITPSGPTSEGYLNGLWVVRTESDELPLDGGLGHLVSVSVVVTVYETANGIPIASISRRLVRRKP